MKTINAIGVEGLFSDPASSVERDERMETLAIYSGAGVRILTVDYLRKDEWCPYRDFIWGLPFPVVPYAAVPDQQLDELTGFIHK